MADITHQGALVVNKPSIQASPIGSAYGPLTTAMSGDFIAKGNVTCGSSSVALPVPAGFSPGKAMFQNNDTAATVVVLDHNQTGNPTIASVGPVDAWGPGTLPAGCVPYIKGSATLCIGFQYDIFSL